MVKSGATRSWVTRSVVGIILATFFSDVGHEMVTAVLPMYLSSVGLGAAVLGVMEGCADLLFSISKLAGGFVGHHVEKKRPWATLGYLTTTAWARETARRTAERLEAPEVAGAEPRGAAGAAATVTPSL